jgi:hypothetical protein
MFYLSDTLGGPMPSTSDALDRVMRAALFVRSASGGLK